MRNVFIKSLFCFVVLLFCITTLYAQTLTIQNFIGGSYTPSSTIGVPFNLNTSGGCIQQTNKYNLYLSDASGNFTPGTIIGSYTGAYATFVNGIIPAGTPSGSGYKVMIKSTAPAISSSVSASFSIINGAVVTAAITGDSPLSGNNTFGTCNGQAGNTYNFGNTSTTPSSTASFFNESTQSSAGTVSLNTGGTFTAAATNYTILVKADNGTSIGTEAYSLINNVAKNSFAVSNTNTVCLGSALTYFVDYTSASGVQNNYPGLIYSVSWGDGITDNFSLCDLIAAHGQVTHIYTAGSCGSPYVVSMQPKATYCSSLTAPITSQATVLKVPVNSFIFQPNGCSNAPITFTNTSDPGQDPTTGSCINTNARYTWYVDGNIVLSNVPITTPLNYQFTHGTHTITLHLNASTTGACTAADVTQSICIQDPPQPAFTLSATAICLSNTITTTDQSVVDPACSAVNTYSWIVTGPAPVSYANGNASSHTPEFKFTKSGIYQVKLTISSATCSATTPAQTILVDDVPTVSLSTDFTVCGASSNNTYSFGPAAGPTQTNISGTAQAQSNTYTWSVTGNTGYNFVSSTANSQYPQIQFTNYGTYNVSVTVVNSCGTVTKTQKITFQQVPVVQITAPADICPGSTVPLTGSITPQAGTSFTWVGSGGFSAPTSLVTDYTPSLAEIAAHSATISLNVNTGLGTPCNSVIKTITINIFPENKITSPPTAQICTKNALNYPITSTLDPASTYLWTAAVTSGSATGFTASGNSSTITDVITNTDPVNNAVVTYTITPYANGCPGTPSTLAVTVKPDPIAAVTPATNTICSGSTGNINISSNITGTTYTWTSAVQTGSITGNHQQTTPTTNNAIADVLNNTGTTTATIIYTITPFNGSCQGTPVTATINVEPLPSTANAGPGATLCNATTYTLNGNIPAVGTGKWTVSPATNVTFSDDTQPNAVASGLVPGTTYIFTWTISSSNCPPNSSNVTIKDDAPPVGGTTSGATTVCSGSNSGTITLSGQFGNITGWEKSTDGVTWLPVANTSTTLQYLNLTTTTQYRAVVQNGSCGPVYSTPSTITVNPPAVLANAGPNDNICNATVYTLQGNSPAPATGKWTQISGPPVTFADDTQPNTTVTGLIPGNAYQFTWTITPALPCAPSSSSVTIKVDPLTVGGTTSGNAIVCGGANSGTITLSGQVGNILRWENSIDGNTWHPINNTNATQTYLNLTTTTQYRAAIQSNSCPVQYSTVTTISVNPPVMQANAGNDQNLCGAVSTTLIANDPMPFTGQWTQTSGPPANILTPGNYKTAVNGLIPGSNYTFLWTIKAPAPCTDSSSPINVFTAPDITPSFTADKVNGCGAYTVNFTNTSTALTGTTFLWDFGDGTQSNSVNPSHTFNPRTDGRDTTYQVSLTIVNNCFQRPAYTVNITVSPKNPVASILPDKLNGCAPFVLTVKNTSPGNTNLSYVFYLYNGSTLIQQITKTDKSDAVFDPINTATTQIYSVYMVATGSCNTTSETTHIPVTVSPSRVTPQMFIENNVSNGCVPLNVTFINNSSGGQEYYYTIYNGDNKVIGHYPAGKNNYPYTFNTVGTYYVTITASDNCSASESPKTKLEVYPIPLPQFDADVKSGCGKVTVNFTNLTADDVSTSASSLTYTWDFGDNTQATGFIPPAHTYDSKLSSYTVTLTAVNSVTGCSNTTSKTGFIVVYGLPGTEFSVKPDSVINIPDYHFSFVDLTTGSPATWSWTFGDGGASSIQNPQHTYRDTGIYKVTLSTTNALGCNSTVVHRVRITGVPGQLFLPNAFEPDGLSLELRTFKAKGSGLKEWHMQIFNNYAQLIWETTKLSDKGEPVEGWDGTFKGSPVPQGVYVWQVSAKLINGTEWMGNVVKTTLPKRVGVVHLIR